MQKVYAGLIIGTALLILAACLFAKDYDSDQRQIKQMSAQRSEGFRQDAQ